MTHGRRMASAAGATHVETRVRLSNRRAGCESGEEEEEEGKGEEEKVVPNAAREKGRNRHEGHSKRMK